jgi:hypothetical protein
MAEEILPERRPVGRPPKSRDAHEIMAAEIIELVELGRRTRKLASTQLDKLQAEAEGITNIKMRLEICKNLVNLHGELVKTAKTLITEVGKGDGEKDEIFDIDKFTESLQKG